MALVQTSIQAYWMILDINIVDVANGHTCNWIPDVTIYNYDWKYGSGTPNKPYTL